MSEDVTTPPPPVPPGPPAPGATWTPGATPYAAPAAPAYGSTPSYAPTSAYAPGPTWPAPRPSGGSSAVGVIALVLSVVALLGVLLLGVVVATGPWGYTALGDGGYSDYAPEDDPGVTDDPAMRGTAPGMVVGQTYSGDRLALEVARVYENMMMSPEGFTCADIDLVESGARSACSGTVDGDQVSVTAELEDGEGHFVLVDEDIDFS
ncbi:hypothetical protein [Luteipulveratus halotolerans]|uniref:DUF4333 domain-containing protein n=1 Tax=Luteipulveratus halotolerans TaxID=1631356 RepID=A0A0L6CG25_9MICO|nr:hypothetical protein [Luteipulveratus halotolerans]KNX36664.1 hypothetical protein VV01_05080 [Luteipulveratus halotolerans]